VWGDVTPAERLRAVTRRHVDDDRLAAEAADALAGFASEPASLVVACRRVLAHHVANGALWWVCSRILAAAEPVAAAREAVKLLDTDRTAERLGATLPLLDEGEAIAAIGWFAAIDEALVERFDLEAVAIRVDGADPTPALRYRHSDHNVRVVDPWDATLPTLVVIVASATAIGPASALVPAGTNDALQLLGREHAPIWLAGGVGRVLPGRLYDVMVGAVREDETYEQVDLERFDRIAGPRGVERVEEAVSRIDCPLVPELLRAP
jgi:hypothetical protein